MDPALSLLTGDSAGELIEAVLDAAGGRPQHWSAAQVEHQPGTRTTVSYTVRVCWAGGAVTTETLGACSGELPAGVARLGDGRTEIGMWRFPFDPELPALPLACDPRELADLLGGQPARLRVRAYRPRRRAVVEANLPGGRTVFVKVVRPDRARGLHERHRLAVAAGCPVPDPLGWSERGLVLLPGLPGRDLRAELLGGRAVLPDPAAIEGVLDALPEVGGRLLPTWGQRAPYYAEVLAGMAPELAGRARAIAAAVRHESPEGPAVPVHGDFYESQLLVAGCRVSGLLDLDTLGRGERLDDAGCLLAHLSLLARLRPEAAARIEGFGHALTTRLARGLDPAALARRVAAVSLSLATGPHRVREPDRGRKAERRLALAQRWLDRGGW
ncbi:phosphotransferase family enzyme [Amycolatopsis cihanbeyliensis]|uniref:Phosphotransferase family enzyme n=2 Tax=Amycolatopsis cihanbeyliensis TaxID=1128664 RepID=A0A542DMC8_AMYCI|nr:phosphotransferase family enzyme [Amycolatopsis cihanbeyliensis]